jgi:hypothetical protein
MNHASTAPFELRLRAVENLVRTLNEALRDLGADFDGEWFSLYKSGRS